MRISKSDQTYHEIEVGDMITVGKTQMDFYNSGNKVIYQPKDKQCLYVKNVGF